MALALLAGGVVQAQEATPVDSAGAATAVAAEYRVGPTDVLAITVFGEADLSGPYPVEADGTFNFPLIGRVTAGGLTLRNIESELDERLRDGFFVNPQVSVAVEQFRSQRVSVVGEVRSPGQYPLTDRMTLLDALASAGSVSADAAGHALIVRQASPGIDETRLEIDLNALQAGSLDGNVALWPGDTIIVPRAERFFVLGQVGSPGEFPLRGPTTVLQALALAGGVAERGSMGRIRIVRIVDGEEVEISADLEDLVQGGDTIRVLERFF
jgi:polysaccharide export outer membrane protein